MKLKTVFSIAALTAATFSFNGIAQTYGNFQGIPMDGTVCTVADFGLDPSTNPKKLVVTKQYEDFLGRGYDKDIQTVEFDDNGRMTSFSFNGASYAPLRVQYEYGPDGKVSKINVMEQLVTMVNKPTPLVTKDYTYNWNNGRVSSISETINVDKGLNYKGSPVTLTLNYGANGKIASATSKQSSRIKFNFDANGKKTDGRSWQCDGYNNGYPYDVYDNIDEVFHMVNTTRKVPLHWSNMDDDVNLVYGMPFEVDLTQATVTKDDKGNWVKAEMSGGEFPDIFTRVIEY